MEITGNISSLNAWRPLFRGLFYGIFLYGLYSFFFLLSSHFLSAGIFYKIPAGHDGTIFCLSTLFSTIPFLVFLCVFSVTSKERARAVLGLHPVSLKEVGFAALLALLSIGIYDAISVLVNGAIVPDPVIGIWRTTHPQFLFVMVFLGAAPLFEELFFRGFLFHVFSRSPVGHKGAAFITALFWGMGHTQYGGFGMAVLFFLGLVLAFLRIKAHSIYPALVFHLIVNLVTLMELTLYFKRM